MNNLDNDKLPDSTMPPLDHNRNHIENDDRKVRELRSFINENNFCIEKIACYQTANFLYVIGSNNCQTKHRVLKIDRRTKNNLTVCDDQGKRILSSTELQLYQLEQGFLTSAPELEIAAFGIVGVVRFLEGFYLILITQRRCVAIISRHCVYQIEDTIMVYIPKEGKGSRSSVEKKYYNMFKEVDLKTNFYFSYSYDLTNTLQYNLAPICLANDAQLRDCGFGHSETLWGVSQDFIASRKYADISDNSMLINPNMKFVWNEHLLVPMYFSVHNDFFLYITHGFVGQFRLPISARKLNLTLIARRSKKYAGTRYYKRGANFEGSAANEVETEQIVHDDNVSSYKCGLFTSFVQIRGSVPTLWSQSIGKKKIVHKPPIKINLSDPFFETTGKHFNCLLYDYGSPIIVLNLMKRKEAKPQEGILYAQYEEAISYLNQFIPLEHQIEPIGCDMALLKNIKDQHVMEALAGIAQYILQKTGYFQSRRIAINEQTGWPMTVDDSNEAIIQKGIVRVNCVDCLDRTNSAQFAIGQVALGYQLFTMGAIADPVLKFETDIVQLLKELYEVHGDTIAMQYAGSSLVRHIDTYQGVANRFIAQPKDTMQSLTRYYSNAFNDWDKQNAINLFLGVYRVNKSEPIWKMNDDYQLHHRVEEQLDSRTSFTKWWCNEVALCCPRAARELFKGDTKKSVYVKRLYNHDWFGDVHRKGECTAFSELFAFSIKKHKSNKEKPNVPNAKHNRLALGTQLAIIGELSDGDFIRCNNDKLTHVKIRFGSQAVEFVNRGGGRRDGQDCATNQTDFADRPNSVSNVAERETKTGQFYQKWLDFCSEDIKQSSLSLSFQRPFTSESTKQMFDKYLQNEQILP